MAAQSAATNSSIAERRPSKGGAVDKRTLVARRLRELMEIYTVALGGPGALSEGQRVDVRKAAELTALAEAKRAKALREGTGDAAELSAMIRLESTAARAVRALNLPAGGAATRTETLAEYAVRKAAEKAARGGGGSPA